MALTLVLMPVVVGLSYSPIVGISTVKLLEPLAITAATMTPAGVCTTTTFTFACTISVFPGDSGSMSVTVFNNSNSPIIATMTSNSTNPVITITNPVPTTLASGGATVILWTYSVSQSAVPDPVTVHFIISR